MKSRIDLYNKNHMIVMKELLNKNISVDMVYADCIYDSPHIHWIYYASLLLKENGIIQIQTDYHTVATYKYYLDSINLSFLQYGQLNKQERLTFVNWVIYKQEWGGVPRNRFPQKHDDILIYCRGDQWKWYGDRIQIPKVTAGTKLDKKGTGMKTPCSVFDDLGNFSTISKERIKLNGKNIQWQKPLKLMDRLLLPFTDDGDTILDPFMGSGTTGVWCKQNNRHFIGIENDNEVFDIAAERIALT